MGRRDGADLARHPFQHRTRVVQRLGRLVDAGGVREMERRGTTEEEAKAVPPFGGPIYANNKAKPTRCTAEQGIDPDGVVHFPDDARYVYMMEAGTKNPGVPPNLDLPEGTLWP